MSIPVKSKSGFLGTRRKKLITTTLIAVLLSSSLLVYVFINDSNWTSVHVKSEEELKKAINNTTSKRFTIALDDDIILTDTITIPAYKDITLTSNKSFGYYRLIGTVDKSTITVEDNGILRLNGIIVTHRNGVMGRGLEVAFGGECYFYEGEISGNSALFGGGVCNRGTFTMLGGKISGNTVTSDGGGVDNFGVFVMSDGEISDNIANFGGGLLNREGVFTMSGGKISGNTAYQGGGGVDNYARTFSLTGGEISGNTANYGGGVNNGNQYYSHKAEFIMSGGVISCNTALNTDTGGGGVANNNSFIMSDGVISNNTATNGGGIYNIGTFSRSGGEITGNTANNSENIYEPQ